MTTRLPKASSPPSRPNAWPVRCRRRGLPPGSSSSTTFKPSTIRTLHLKLTITPAHFFEDRSVKKAKAGQAVDHSKTIEAESAEQRELRRLRAENDYLREQREILKKALGICSAQMPASVSR